MPTITWLHLSDLHFRTDQGHAWDEDVVLRALLDDLSGRRAQDDLHPDFIVVSGDVAYSGQPDEYDLARSFFDDLLAATGLGKERLFPVPGNHDVDRARIGVMAELLGPTLTTREGVNKVLGDATTRQAFLERFAGYAAFTNDYLGHSAFNDEALEGEGYFHVHRLDLAGQRIAILGLNSAWLAQGGEGDRHKLALGERQVRAALDAAEDAGLRLALFHHPFDWLQDSDRADAEALLCGKCDFVLHGHMHQVGLLQARTPDSNAFIIAAGACYETRQHPNAYNLVQLDPTTGQGAVHLRTYSDRGGGFWTKDTLNYRGVPDGVYHFSLRGAPAPPPGPEQPASVTIIDARDGAIAIGEGATALGAGATQMQVQGDVHGDVLGPGATKTKVHLPDTAGEALAQARRRYLVQLRRSCNALPLAALGGEESADEDVTLDKVYVALNTRTPVPLTEEEKKEREGDLFSPSGREDTRPLTALEAATQSNRLVLLGDPGGGKSTFVRQLLAWLAAHQLGEGEPPPEGLAPMPEGLLPVLITLRDLVPRLQGRDWDALPAGERRAALARLVRDQALAGLERLDAGGFAKGLDRALAEGCCFLAFDGLDEVPPALRRWVRLAIQAAIGHYALPRVIVTCRVRSYSGEAELPHFDDHTLAPFDPDQVRAFVAAWYAVQRELGRVDAVEAGKKTADLQEAALAPDLRELSANPMLLTTMAIIHQKEIGLPRERVRLYNLAVDVLLSRWQKRKAGGAGQSLAPDLAALLADERKLRQVVERLAYVAHSLGRNEDERQAADLARGRALTLLEAPAYLGDAGLASRFLDYVDRRAGLLVGRGGSAGNGAPTSGGAHPGAPASGGAHPGAYSFPHRTFQEYLAGCYIVGQRDVARELWRLVREGDYWQLAAQLGAEELLYNRRNDYGLLDLAYRLCPGGEPDAAHTWRAHTWSGQMAALLGRAFVEADCDTPDCGPDYLARLLPRLVGLLEGNHLDAHERAAAGEVLAQLGDPRFGEDVWYLPTRFHGDPEPLLGFVEVPAGPFLMGSSDNDALAGDEEKPQHEQHIPYDYWMARYPVTQAQYWAFVQDTGHKAPTAEVGYDSEKAYEWRDGQPPSHRLNQPVVLVTWHDARAYCEWLAENLRSWEGTPEPVASLLRAGADGGPPWVARLPTEAEWEKAARGPSSSSGQALVFPWADEPDPDRANYVDTGLGATSAAGCFPGGESPYGLQDLSGNVWEWCHSLYKDYPYDLEYGREDPEDSGLRVLRGGAFFNSLRLVRCACRDWLDPNFWDDNFGFRVVVAPGLPLGAGRSGL